MVYDSGFHFTPFLADDIMFSDFRDLVAMALGAPGWSSGSGTLLTSSRLLKTGADVFAPELAFGRRFVWAPGHPV